MAIVIPMTTQNHGGGWVSLRTDHVLQIAGARCRRWGVGAVPRGSEGRQVDGGPMVPGPWAYVYALSTVIDNYGGTAAESERKLAAGTEHRVAAGDLVEIDGVIYRIEIPQSRFYTVDPKLVPEGK